MPLSSTDVASVSVIIPNLNSPVLDQVLDGVMAQHIDPEVQVEVFVIGQDQPGHLRRFPQVNAINTPQPVGPAEARNLGIRQARGRLIACLDADCVPDLDWITAKIAAHTRYPDRTVIGGSIKIESDNVWTLADNLSSFHAYLPTRLPGRCAVLPTCNLSVQRTAFEEVGLFDESFLINEDVDWTMRARRLGYELRFDPCARIWHRPQRRTFQAVMQHARQWGYYSIVNRRRYSDIEPLPWILRRRTRFVVLSPLIAAAVAGGAFARNPSVWRYVHVFPIILLAKLMWCRGAAQRLKELELQGGKNV